jgi:hypothetical protein
MDSSGPPGDSYDDVMNRAHAAVAALNRAAIGLAQLATSRRSNDTADLDEVLQQLRAELADPT